MDLVSATDLELWTARRDAQAVLPQLVRRLIQATADGLTRLSVRAGEGVGLPGWDGVSEADRATAFVPDGLAVWEMGVGEPAAKANGDYRKRTDDPDGVDRAATTFVFVSPRRWDGKDVWVTRRNAEGHWKNVVALDADDLETWLESAPAVHCWISSLLGKDPHEAESLEVWWQAWAGATSPALPPAVLLSGRDAEVDRLRVALAGSATATSVAADSGDEALAFVAAALLAHDAPLLERALIVRTPAAWRRLSVSQVPLLLIPTFDRPPLTTALQAGHQVVLALGREVPSSSGGISLPRLRRAGVEAALTDAGLHRDKASPLATLARRSLPALRRSIAVNADAEAPAWALPEHAAQIAPAVLAGSWTDASPGDRDAVAAIAGRPYDEVIRDLTRWANASDPPIRRVGDVWMATAKADTWALTARSLTTDDLDRFRRVAVDVLGEDDPVLDLAPDQRMMAGILGKQRRHSSALVKGVADSLALLAATSDDVPLAGGRRGETEAVVIVRQLLEAANDDLTGRRWHAVSGVLPLLAEAAPAVALREFEAGSRTANGPVVHLFQDGDSATTFTTSSPHSSLLWALETLAWNSVHLPHAALRLAALTRLEPGGTTLNRPFNSLRDVLLLWRPGTAASLDERIQVLDHLRLREPGVAWRMALALIPTGDGFASATASPAYRDWKPEDEGGVLVVDLVRAVDAVVERAVEDAGTDGARWAALLHQVASSSFPARDHVVQSVERLDPATVSPEGRQILYRALRDLVAKHRQFPDATWAMPVGTADRLAALVLAFEPTDPTARHAWLFEQRALDAFPGDDYNARHQSLGDAQDVALQEILADVGLVGLVAWAADFAKEEFSAMQIGETLARTAPDDPEALALLRSDDEMARKIGVQYVHRVAARQGVPWVENALDRTVALWEPERVSLFLRALPTSADVWPLAALQGHEVERDFWANVHPYALPSEGEDALQAARKLIDVERSRDALHVLQRVVYHDADAVPHELLAHALEEAIRTAAAPFDSSLAHDVGAHLDRLDDAEFDSERLARLEWAYLPLFRFERRSARILHRSLAGSPSFFVDVLSLAFRARGEEPRDLSDAEQAMARSAHALLDSWRLVPGTTPEGDVNADALDAWISDARAQLVEANRAEVGEGYIGRVLRYAPPAPPDEDEPEPVNPPPPPVDWPSRVVRDAIEAAASTDLETGFELEVHNSRGVTSRGPTDGGAQERVLADLYRRRAASAGLAWPRTSAMLTRIAESYERHAEREDRDADLTEDTWS